MKGAIIFATLGICLVATGCLSVCKRPAEYTDKALFRADAVMKATLQRFVELKDAGRLPGLVGDKHGELDAIYIDDRVRRQEWFLPFGDGMNRCREMCLVRVELKDYGDEFCHAYLFCCDGKVPELVGTYIFKHGQWRRLMGGVDKRAYNGKVKE